MIEKPTVLVLGAGASVPYRFPLGRGLVHNLCQKPQFSNDYVLSSKDSRIRPLGFEKEEIDTFLNSLARSGRPSVDAFLEHRPEFVAVGKAAIANALIQCEVPRFLFEADHDHWYEHLFQCLNTGFEEFGKNCLSILTFNYDRSLEEYLVTALANAYGKSKTQASKVLQEIPIIHLHGTLGEHPYTGLPGREYSNINDTENIQAAANSIRIISEATERDPQFSKAREKLAAAHRCCFLGFGYHRDNVLRLKYGQTFDKVKSIHGSTLGMTEVEVKSVQQLFGRQTFISCKPGMESLEFLRNTGILFY